MTWQNIFYFSTILLTCGLTGFLAYYAWRQPALPGVRVYAGLALSECLLALAEILSMLSTAQTQALFWFQVRFFFTAIIPVIWLAFTLAYSGQQAWLSKKLVFGAFIIPVITQVLLWSNTWHGLWVKQEVSFHQNGPLWIAETIARIPSLWFMVHSFYSLILLMVGIGVILVVAWQKRHSYRGQALLLSAGALVALITTLIPLFNLLPLAEFNPFIPGIGISALLYALAVFRFKFLKAVPATDADSPARFLKAQENRSLAAFLFIFILMVAGIAAAGYVSYITYEQQFRGQVESQLSAIANLKVDGLQNWLSERKADAATLYHNPVFARLVQQVFENPGDTKAHIELQGWLDTVQQSYRYEQVFLLDTKSVNRLSAPSNPDPVNSFMSAESSATLLSGQVTFLDIHRDFSTGPIHLSMLVPILEGQDATRPLGLLVLRIDPQTYLYPFINQWPTSSQSAETLLVRRDGNQALFLTELRFQKNTALNLHLSLDTPNNPAVNAVMGHTGFMEGLDYRGVWVVAYLLPVPDSPWFLVARIDIAEVYAPLRARLWETLAFFGILITAAGTGLTLVWRRQRIRYLQSQIKTAAELRETRDYLENLLNYANAPIIVWDPHFTITKFNHTFEHLTGYSAGEVIGKHLEMLFPAESRNTTLALIAQTLTGERWETVEIPIVHRDGSTRIALWNSANLMDPESKKLLATIAQGQDITERKRAEEALYLQNQYLIALQETALDLISQLDLNVLLENIVKRAGQLMGTSSGYLDLADKTGQLKPQIGFGALTESLQHTVIQGEGLAGTVWQTGKPLVINDYDIWAGRIGDFSRQKLGAIIGVPLLSGQQVVGVLGLAYEYGSNRFFGQEVVGILTQFARLAAIAIENAKLFATAQQELAQRKQIEVELRETSDYLENLLNYANAPIIVWDPDFTITKFNHAFERLSGYSADEVIGRHLKILFPVDSQYASLALIAQTLSGERWETVEIPILHRNGSNRIALWNSANLVDPVSGSLLATIAQGQDITERKRAEAQLEEHHATLNAILESAATPVFSLDRDYRYSSFNSAHAAVMKALYAAEIEIGQSMLAYQTLPEDRELAKKDLDRALGGEQIVESAYSGEPGRTRRFFEISHNPIHGTAGEVIGVSVFVSDITERKQAEETLLEYNLRLELEVDLRTRELRDTQDQLVRQERLATLGQLAGSVGHELRNPLGVISNAVYFLKLAQPDASPQVKEYLQMIENETRSSDKFISELLDFTRIKSFDRSPVHIPDIVLQTLERYPIPPEIEVLQDLPADLPRIFVDPQHLVQVLGNLVTNACQAMPNGGKLILSASTENPGDLVKITVQDTGKGISPENMKKLFEPLFTTKTKGIGLGLAICKKLVEGNAGQIQVQSELGKGTSFTVLMPIHHTEKL